MAKPTPGRPARPDVPAIARTAVIAGSVAVGVTAGRRRLVRWGASSQEAERPFPGDDIVERPQYSATNAATIASAPSEVWPWLVQLGGYGRAGWYAIDRLDNGGVPSAREIVPELQELSVGDVLATDRDGGGLRVEAIDPRRSLTLSERTPEAVTSCVFVLNPTAEAATRLLVRVRVRADTSVAGVTYRTIMELGHVPRTLLMLRGIKERAEAQGRARHDG